MPTSGLSIDFEFTDVLRDALLEQGVRLPLEHLQGVQLPPMQCAFAQGDMVRFEGIPSDIPMYVLARSWTLMADATRLLIVLDLSVPG